MKYLLIFLTLITCGQQPNTNTDNKEITPAECKDNCPTTAEKEETFKAIAIDTLVNMPACTAANQTQLLFVVSEKRFLYCKNLQWIETDYTNQLCSIENTEESSLVVNGVWTDHKIGISWHIPGTTGIRSLSCKGDWMLADIPTYRTALENGLNDALAEVNSSLYYWTNVGSDTYDYLVFNYKQDEKRVNKDIPMGFLCYKLPE